MGECSGVDTHAEHLGSDEQLYSDGAPSTATATWALARLLCGFCTARGRGGKLVSDCKDQEDEAVDATNCAFVHIHSYMDQRKKALPFPSLTHKGIGFVCFPLV